MDNFAALLVADLLRGEINKEAVTPIASADVFAFHDDLETLVGVATAPETVENPAFFHAALANFNYKYGPHLKLGYDATQTDAPWDLYFASSFSVGEKSKGVVEVRNNVARTFQLLTSARNEQGMIPEARHRDFVEEYSFQPINVSAFEAQGARKSREIIANLHFNTSRDNQLSHTTSMVYDVRGRSISHISSPDLLGMPGRLFQLATLYGLMGGFRQDVDISQIRVVSPTPPPQCLASTGEFVPDTPKLQELSYRVMRYSDIADPFASMLLRSLHGYKPDELISCIYHNIPGQERSLVAVIPSHEARRRITEYGVINSQTISFAAEYASVFDPERTNGAGTMVLQQLLRESIPRTASLLKKVDEPLWVDASRPKEIPEYHSIGQAAYTLDRLDRESQLLLRQMGFTDKPFFILYDTTAKNERDGCIALLASERDRTGFLAGDNRALIAHLPYAAAILQGDGLATLRYACLRQPKKS